MIYLLGAVLLALSVSFVCSLLESAVLSLRPGDIARLRQRDAPLGALWERLRSNIGEPIAAILILNTVANVVGATIAGASFSKIYGERWIWVFSLVFALLIIQWGEILPKTLGVRYRRIVATVAGRPLSFAVVVLSPVMWLTRQLNRVFEPKAKGDGFTTVEEIRSLARYASFARLIDRRQENLITKSVLIHDVTVGRIMVPRTRVVALEEGDTVAGLLAVVERHGYSRVPIYRDHIDDVVGVVLVKDILIALHRGEIRSEDFSSRPIREFMTEPLFVPETTSVADMMAKASESKAHMVIVLDEHGGFTGVVTLEDALEELFGEIIDEHDRAERRMIERVARGRWIIQGLCPIDDLSRALGVELASKKHRYTTLSGLLMWLTGRVPQAGDVIQADALVFHVLEASPTVPRRVEVTLRSSSEPRGEPLSSVRELR